MSLFNNSIMMGASAAGAYEIERSLRFDVHTGTTSGAHLQRTFSSAGNRKTWTFSFWAKKTGTGGEQVVFNGGGGGNGNTTIRWDTDDSFHVFEYNSGFTYRLHTNRLFRDPSAWYHIVVTLDTTQGTADNRIKIYVNGVQETSFANRTNPSQDTDYTLNNNIEHTIGNNAVEDGNANYFNGYLTEINFVDGTALAASSFGETNEDTGQWIPKKYAGSHGTNGFYLNFSDNSNTTSGTLGDDDSANTNDWTPNNLSVAAGVGNDSLEDSPTNNFCTLNSVIGTNARSGATPSNGNLDVAGTDESTNRATFVFGPGNITSGKWYFEVTNTGGVNGQRVGLTSDPNGSQGSSGTFFRGNVVSWFASNGYKKYTETMETSSGSYSTGDVYGVAYNADDDEIKYYKNGTLTLTDDTLPSVATTELHIVVLASNTGSNGWPVGSLNFGQRAFAHTPPTGYEKLCTANLPEPTILKGSDHFNTVLYTGNSGTNAITGVGFSPDFTWICCRSDNRSRTLVDSVRGFDGSSGRVLQSEQSAVEWDSTYFNSLDSDGFTVSGTENYINNSSHTYVSWNWKASDSSAAANDDGNIDSTVSVNATAGFSIGTFSGTGANGTIGHGLGVAPQMILIKNRDSANSWAVYHDAIGADVQLLFNSSNATTGDTTGFTEVPTSTVINVGSGAAMDTNKSGGAASHVFYAFSEVSGYSKFGSYSGNGNNDGTFVYTGFRPTWVLVKKTSGTGNWAINDTERDFNSTYGNDASLYTNSNAQETTSSSLNIDLLSNGMKLRSNNSSYNGSGGTYIYMAFAEMPFKYANAR